jgi:hypothetical protein
MTQNDTYDCPIWIQDLYKKKRNLTGAGHGFVGNLYPFIRGNRFLPIELADWAKATAVETVIKTATIEGNCANWRSDLYGGDSDRPPFLLQWCHGAPGIIISLNAIPLGYSSEFDDLMIKAGEVIWQAGPLKKGIGLCHGTDGNGYAFLKLFKRTGDQVWLDRAQLFAMHAMNQRNRRNTLWTGDLGFACYLKSCLELDDGFPLLDILL